MNDEIISTPEPKPVAPAISIRTRCFYCSLFYPDCTMRTVGESVKMCQDCQHKHVKNMLEFNPPDYCQTCNKSTEQMSLEAMGREVRMAVHYKDGIYQVMCMACDEVYTQKRKDLYADTRFGHNKKLK